MRKILVLILGIFLFSSVYAITCDKTSFEFNYDYGAIPSAQILSGVHCDNSNGTTIIPLSTSFSTFPYFFTLNEQSIGIGSTQQDLNINLDTSLPPGTYNGQINYNGGNIQIVANVDGQLEATEGCRLIELPHTTTYRIKQGDTSSSSQIRIKVSSECTGPMAGMTVTEQTQMSKPMYLQGTSGDIDPGDEFTFTIGLDAEGVSTGTYSNQYVVSGSVGDQVYQKSITLFTIVTSGVSPIDGDSFSDLPDCTLTSDMALNTTYELTCNNNNPNIDIEVPYNEFFQGVSVTESEGTFKYKMKPVKIGNTEFLALFKYKGVSIGEPFTKSIRIVQGSVPISGTDLKILFYQEGVKKELNELSPMETSILIKDNRTDSIVDIFTAYLNGATINSTGFNLESGKNYEMIVSSPGYVSKTINFNVTNTPITLTINPLKDFYYVGDQINITSNVNDTSLLFNNQIINSVYTFGIDGNFTLRGVKQGYTPYEANITVKPNVNYKTMTPLYEDWKKGKTVVIELDESASWNVNFYEEYEENGIKLYRDPINIASGNSNRVEFKLDNYGRYEVNAEGKVVVSNTVSSSSWFSLDTIKNHWVISLFVIVILGGGGYLWFNNKKEDTGIGWSGPTS